MCVQGNRPSSAWNICLNLGRDMVIYMFSWLYTYSTKCQNYIQQWKVMCRSQDESVFVSLFCVYQRGRRARLREQVLACMSIVVGSYFRNRNIFSSIDPIR